VLSPDGPHAELPAGVVGGRRQRPSFTENTLIRDIYGIEIYRGLAKSPANSREQRRLRRHCPLDQIKAIPMRHSSVPVALLLAAGCAGGSAGPAAAPTATLALVTSLIGTTGTPVGTATLTETRDGVSVRFELKGLAPGTHGAHVHAAGKCEPPGFTTAAGHLNTTGKQHGHKNPAGWHLGDVGNVVAKADGTADATLVVRGARPPRADVPAGPNGTTALVVHANLTTMTDPAGNAGAIAWVLTGKRAERSEG
jgi:Cu-Zn family superoxide dismutase